MDETERKSYRYRRAVPRPRPRSSRYPTNLPHPLFWVRRSLKSSILRVLLIRTPFEREHKTPQGETIWTNDQKIEQKIDRVYSTLVALTGLCMLASPLWALAFANGTVYGLAIITGFIALFFFLVAVATYSAVLTYFCRWWLYECICAVVRSGEQGLEIYLRCKLCGEGRTYCTLMLILRATSPQPTFAGS